MSGRTRIFVGLFAAVVVVAAIFVGFAMRALHQVQPFYAAALEVDSNTLADESHAMERRVATLVSDAKQQPSWRAAFSDREVNGWLAVALEEKFADLLPASIVDPRVAFEAEEAVIGFRYEGKEFTAVISMRVNAWISGADVVAIRLLKAHIGTLPIPLTKIVEHMTQAARKLQVPLRWTQQDGAPVALISLPGVLSTGGEQRRLDVVELHEGELYLAGSTFEVESLEAVELMTEKPAGTISR